MPSFFELPAITQPDLDALLRGLARNPSAPPDVLLRLTAANIDRSELARRRDLPADAAAVLAGDRDVSVRQSLASNPSLPPEVQAVLAVDPDRRVRGLLADPSDYCRDFGYPIPGPLELIDEYLKSATCEKEAATARSYADVLRCPRERLGHARVQDVTRRDVEDLRDFMLREGRKIGGKPGTGLGPRTVNFALGRLQAAFALAVADGRLARNPVEHVTRPQETRKPRDTWTKDEVRAFLAEARGTGCTRPGGCPCTGCAAARSRRCAGTGTTARRRR